MNIVAGLINRLCILLYESMIIKDIINKIKSHSNLTSDPKDHKI